MKFLYLLSILLLIISFLILKKNNKKSNIINSTIYSICFLFAYQTVIVYISSLFNLGGNLLYYSFINILISLLPLVITIKNKEIQKYYFNMKELLLYIALAFVIITIVFIRFRGFTILTYMSDDSSIHFRMAKHFKRELRYLTETNSLDLLNSNYGKAIPVSYINGGFILKLFENFKLYKVFIIYDLFCLLLAGLLFLSTIIKLFNKNDNNYLQLLIISILYTIAFPLNNLLYGFFYLGIGIMITNLIFITIKEIETNLEKNLYIKLIILFILNLSLFFSYYLFVPNIYLAMGIYFILLYKQNKISLTTLLKYGIITLIIPFTIGFCHFLLPIFFNKSKSIINVISSFGTIYNNLTPLYLFIIYLGYLMYKSYHKKLNKNDYLSLNIYILSFYCVIFLTLFIFQISKIYYFYKLFYLFSLFIGLALTKVLINKRRIIYLSLAIVTILILIPLVNKKGNISKITSKISIYSYNSNEIFNSNIRFNKDELKLVDMANKNKKECTLNHEFPIVTKQHKKYWYYAITNTIPIINHDNTGSHQLDTFSISFKWWEYNTNHPCLVYFYEGDKVNYSKNKFKVLYQNKSGIILKKRKKTIDFEK